MPVTLQELWVEYRNRPFAGDRDMLAQLDNVGEAIFLAGACAAFRHLDTGGNIQSLQRDLDRWVTALESSIKQVPK